LSHLKTTIYFSCGEGQLESGPEFLERTGCHYQFQWRHAAACPASGITQVRGSVSDPDQLGSVFGLSPEPEHGLDFLYPK